VGLHDHPRLVALEFEGSPGTIWEGLARHGRPIQYSHLQTPLALWDTWTAIAGPPVAFEPPSSGFVLDWDALASMATRGVRFATITHAAGISSTGDPALDALLPFDEPYRIPASTAEAIRQAREGGGRIIAIGTTVVRALEHAAAHNPVVQAGEGMASQRIDASSRLKMVDAILSGTHEPGTSHYDMLRAFADERTLGRIDRELNEQGYRTHEFGDSVFLEDAREAARTHLRNAAQHRGRRGARRARREEGEYRPYSTDEQRRPRDAPPGNYVTDHASRGLASASMLTT
jgi:S-adenosylmethionine:tRNA ribosyltransferase-isomerase